MNKPVGYLINQVDGPSGEKGLFYNYILAANGLFIEAENPVLSARIPVDNCVVRGLSPLSTKIALTYGSIPQRFFDLALDSFLAEPDKEHYVAVIADRGYHFYVPVQDRSGGNVVYETGASVILDMHSHGHMGAFFSSQDDLDEQGLKLYAVVGKLNAKPIVKLRIGVYGYFYPLLWKDVFDGSLMGASEYEEEVKAECDILSFPKSYAEGF